MAFHSGQIQQVFGIRMPVEAIVAMEIKTGALKYLVPLGNLALTSITVMWGEVDYITTTV